MMGTNQDAPSNYGVYRELHAAIAATYPAGRLQFTSAKSSPMVRRSRISNQPSRPVGSSRETALSYKQAWNTPRRP